MDFKSKRHMAEELISGKRFTKHGSVIYFDDSQFPPFCIDEGDGNPQPLTLAWGDLKGWEEVREWYDQIPPEGVLCKAWRDPIPPGAPIPPPDAPAVLITEYKGGARFIGAGGPYVHAVPLNVGEVTRLVWAA